MLKNMGIGIALIVPIAAVSILAPFLVIAIVAVGCFLALAYMIGVTATDYRDWH